MATIESFNRTELKKSNPLLTKFRTTVETAFYGKNMQEVTDMTEAYELALNAAGVVVTDLPVLHAKELGLPDDAKVLVENGGRIIGRTARAKRIVGENKEEDEKLQAIIMDVIYQNRLRHYYKATGYVGLDKDFIIKAHIAFPEGNENNLYSWLLNFQWDSPEYQEMYAHSKAYNEGDIYIYTDATGAIRIIRSVWLSSSLTKTLPVSSECNISVSSKRHTDACLGNRPSQWLCCLPWWPKTLPPA